MACSTVDNLMSRALTLGPPVRSLKNIFCLCQLYASRLLYQPSAVGGAGDLCQPASNPNQVTTRHITSASKKPQNNSSCLLLVVIWSSLIISPVCLSSADGACWEGGRCCVGSWSASAWSGCPPDCGAPPQHTW